MANYLEYKGFFTKVRFDSEDKLFYGKIEGINDFVNFEADNMNDAEIEFHNAVDDYIDFREQIDKDDE